MKVTVEVTFPCSEEEWKRVLTIRSLAGGMVAVTRVQELTDKEESVLRSANGTDSETPLLDIMAKQGLGKVNVSQVCSDYVSSHPGVPIKECVHTIATQYGLDPTKVQNIVHTGCYAKGNQRRYDKANGCLYPHVHG